MFVEGLACDGGVRTAVEFIKMELRRGKGEVDLMRRVWSQIKEQVSAHPSDA